MEATNWGDVGGVTDNSEARTDPSGDSAYTHDETQPGKVAGIRGRLSAIEGNEPKALWLIVVGSIAALFVLGKAFRTVRA